MANSVKIRLFDNVTSVKRMLKDGGLVSVVCTSDDATPTDRAHVGPTGVKLHAFSRTITCNLPVV